MSKEELERIRQMVKFSPTEQDTIQQQRKIEEEKIRKKSRECSCFNLERLKKTGIVGFFEEIQTNGVNNESFIIEYSKNNTEIRLYWNKNNDSNKNKEKKYISARINNGDQLSLQKVIEEPECYYHGQETLIKDNLSEVISKKLIENKDPQPQIPKRSFLDRLLGK